MSICRLVSRHGEEKGTCVCSDVYMPLRPTLQNQIKVQDSVSSMLPSVENMWRIKKKNVNIFACV